MHVSDVDSAFLIIPLHPDLWPFFMFRFYASDTSRSMHLFMHVFGDFGAAGMPGTFKVIMADVILGMARSCMVLTLPMVIYVDDLGLIGPCREQAARQMRAFQLFCESVCGVFFKHLKDRVAVVLLFCFNFYL